MNVSELCQKRIDDPAVDVGQAVISPLEFVGEAKVVNAEESEDCGVEVVYVHWVCGNIITEIICFAINKTFLYSCTSHPHSKTTRMMVPSIIFGSKPPL